MTLNEYLMMDTKDLVLQDVREVRKAAESKVNVFGFDAKGLMEDIKGAVCGGINATAFAVCCAYYEATEQTWIDGRNEFSNERLKKICCTEEFMDVYRKLETTIEPYMSYFRVLAQEIGRQLHRTNLQTLSSFIIYVLGTQADEALCKKVIEVCDNEEKFWRLPMI